MYNINKLKNLFCFNRERTVANFSTFEVFQHTHTRTHAHTHTHTHTHTRTYAHTHVRTHAHTRFVLSMQVYILHGCY